MGNKAYPPSITPGIPRLGRCPQGWSKTTFGDVLRVVERPAMLEDDKEYQLVNAKRSRGGIVPRERLTGREIKTKGQYFVRTGDFLIANRQIIHGACGIVPPKLDGALVSGEYTVSLPKDGLHLPWFSYFTHTTYFQQTCFHSSIGVDVEKMVFKLAWWLKHGVHIPSLPEQTKMADILATWDEAIEQARTLIAAAKRRKKALMQKLLMGKKRLPGFAGQWRRSPVAKVCTVRVSGVDKKTSNDEIPVRLCNYTDVYYNDIISTETPFMAATATGNEVALFELRKGDVLCTKDSETPDDIAKCAHVSHNMPGVLCGYHLALLRPKTVVEGPFLCQAMNAPASRLAFSRCANGVTRFGLSSDAFDQVQIPVPSLLEQRAIAAILTTADEEIKFLEAKCAALDRQKKGLMQKLLTGEVRVIERGKS